MTSKNCTKCNVVKPLSEFTPKNYYCKKCTAKYSYMRAKTKYGLINRIYGNQINSSKRRNNIKPNYLQHELREWAMAQPIFHKLYDEWVLSDYCKMMAPSFDRTDDYTGYSLDRLTIMTWQENKDKAEDDKKTGKLNKISKPVIQMTLSGEFINRHYSMSNADRLTGVNLNSICSCCNSRLLSAGGFRWMYAIN